MPEEPKVKQAVAFFDGQNLFHSAREAFGHKYPNYDPHALSRMICDRNGWDLVQVRFYTGMPDVEDDPVWNHFWTHKLAAMGRKGVYTYARSLRYRNQTVVLPNGNTTTILVGQEKGIDVRIALDIVRQAREKKYDVALVFSQDQDLSEVADEIRSISMLQKRWIKMACAFPVSPTSHNKRGIDKTEWIRINRADYDSCLDPRDYRPKK